MRIALWSPRNDLTGNRKLVTMLARELGRRHAVTVWYPAAPDLKFEEHLLRPLSPARALRRRLGDAARAARHPAWRYRQLLNGGDVTIHPYWRALPEAALEKADVLVYFSPYQAMELFSRAGGRAARVFYEMHDHTRTDAHLVDMQALRQAYAGAAHVIALSEETQRHLGDLGVRSEAVVPGGIDVSVFCPGPRRAAPDPVKILGYYWPQEPRKGAETLRRALEQIRARHPRVAVSLLAPKGAALPGCEMYSEISEAALAELYRRHDIFIYPNISGGGFGLPPLEAMACGCAVVATNVGAIGDFARHGVSALLCDPNPEHPDRTAGHIAEGVDRLIADAPLREQLRAAAAQQAAGWSWEKAAERLERYLMQLLRQQPGA